MAQATRRARAEGGESSALRVATYEPRDLDPAVWKAVRGFVTECADRLALGDWASATRTLRTLTRLSAWALEEGMALDPELILDPDTVERFVANGLAGERSRATYRAVLRRIGPLLTTRAPWEPPPPSVARRQVAAPYTVQDIELLRVDAVRQGTPHKRRAARALLALGAGAGLDGRWVIWVAAEDVIDDSFGLVVRVGGPAARAVPVLASWEEEIRELAATAAGEFLVGGHSRSRNRAGALTASLEVPPGHPRLSAARLRSTWLLWHLSVGTRLPELAAAAGLQSVTVLSDLLDNVPRMPEAEARRMLRGVPR